MRGAITTARRAQIPSRSRQPPEDAEDTMDEIIETMELPLFPLNTVLFLASCCRYTPSKNDTA